jgi:D-amino-acid dehydrogenase
MSSAADSVLVVGGGIIGIACAHYLSEAGYRVTVIDRDEVGAACSYANCGMICPSHVLPLNEPSALWDGIKSLFNPRAAFRIRPQLRPALYQWLWQFTRRCTHSQMIDAGTQLQRILDSTMQEYRDLFDNRGLGGEWKENGLGYVFRTKKGLRAFQATDELLTEHYGISAQRIEGEDLPDFDPALKSDLAGAYFYDDDASARPDALVHHWVRRLSDAGVAVIEHCQLESVEKQGQQILGLVTSRGKMSADHYVFATGAWSSQLSAELACKIPVEPGKGYSVTMSRPGISPRHPMLFPEHRVGVTPFDDSYRLGSMMEFSGFDSSIPPHRIQQLQDSAVPYLVEPAGEIIQETWYGWRPMTWDSLPIIGRVPALDNALLATGHNMLGLTLAPATGKLIAELIDEREPHIAIEAFSPSRF